MKRSLLAGAVALLLTGTVGAAEVVLVNRDQPGAGLNDTTVLAPAGGNPGKTVGEQRRIAYQYAADLWGAVLESDAQIRVEAGFSPLTCTAGRTVLGSARANPIYILQDEEGNQILFHGALADALVGHDLDDDPDGIPGRVDIISNFNASYGNTNPNGTACAPGSGWYYGLDGNTPEGLTSFLDTVMHEIAHGLGFSGFGSVTSGAPFAGYPDIYSSFAFDNNTQLAWYDMTDAQRRDAVIGGAVAFTGPAVTAEAPTILADRIALRSTGTVEGEYVYGTASFGAEVTETNFSGELVLVNDGSATAPNLGCVASPPGAYTGRIAVVDRGTCAFEIKVKHAEDAGATAVLVANNTTGVIGMAEDPSVIATIPTLMVSQADGNALKAGIPGVRVALQTIAGELAGADAQNRVLLYAPNPVESGSSFSHFTNQAAPNLLMEPAISDSLASNIDLDLTPALFQDEGWVLNPGNGTIGTCDTGVDAVEPGGLAVGASIQAYAKMCVTSAKGSRATYLRCVTDYANKLKSAGAITSTQSSKVRTCAAGVTF